MKKLQMDYTLFTGYGTTEFGTIEGKEYVHIEGNGLYEVKLHDPSWFILRVYQHPVRVAFIWELRNKELEVVSGGEWCQENDVVEICNNVFTVNDTLMITLRGVTNE